MKYTELAMKCPRSPCIWFVAHLRIGASGIMECYERIIEEDNRCAEHLAAWYYPTVR